MTRARRDPGPCHASSGLRAGKSTTVRRKSQAGTGLLAPRKRDLRIYERVVSRRESGCNRKRNAEERTANQLLEEES